MEKVIRVSRSFGESDRSDKEYYQGLSPIERLEIQAEGLGFADQVGQDRVEPMSRGNLLDAVGD